MMATIITTTTITVEIQKIEIMIITTESLIKMVKGIMTTLIQITEIEIVIGIITINKDQTDKTSMEYMSRSREMKDIENKNTRIEIGYKSKYLQKGVQKSRMNQKKN